MPIKDPQLKKEYQKKWLNQRREAWINANGAWCKYCGSTENLQIDHIDPIQKSLSISQIWSRSTSVRDAELLKCQVLCIDCHKKKTFKDMRYGKHGDAGYNRGCRCDICTKERIIRVNEWRWHTGRRKRR